MPRPEGTARPESPEHPRRRDALRGEGRYFLELAAMCAFAIGGPVLDTFGGAPEMFVFRDASRGAIVAFAFLLALGPPVALGLVGAAVRAVFGRPVRAVLQAVLLAALAALATVRMVKQETSWPTGVVVASAAAGVVLILALYLRADWFRTWLGFLSAASLLFAGVFLFASDVSPLLASPEPVDTPEIEADTPVVMLMLDEFPTMTLLDRSGEIDASRFPGIAAFARDATWYPNYTAMAEDTPVAVPTTLTGRAPRNAPATYDSYPRNLFSLLGGAYEIHAAEAATKLCPERLCGNTQDHSTRTGLTALLDDAQFLWRQLVSPERKREVDFTRLALERLVREADPLAGAGPSARFLHFLETIERAGDGQPPLHFAHVVLPHNPWYLYGEGATYFARRNLPGLVSLRWLDREPFTSVNRMRHVLQARATDTLVSALVDRLREVGLYDDALVIVTADHGVSTHPGRLLRGLEEGNEHEIALVPLLVKYPGQRGGRVDRRNVLQVDVLPTIADAIGVDIPWPVDGVSALGPRRPAEEKPFQIIHGAVQPGASRRVELPDDLFDRAVAEVFPPPPPGFGDDRDLGVLATGPLGELLGTPIARLPSGDAAGLTLDVVEEDSFDDVDTGAALPALVEAALSGAPPGADPVVVLALNGRVAAAARAEPLGDDEHHVVALLPAGSFRDGANELTAYVTDAADSTTTLHEVRIG